MPEVQTTRPPETSTLNIVLIVCLVLAILLGAAAAVVAHGVGNRQAEAALGEQLAAKDKQIADLRKQVSEAAAKTKRSGKEPPPPVTASTLTAADLGVAALLALPAAQQTVAMGVLNTVVGPCDPCIDAGLSLATCAKAKKDLCANMAGLVDRSARLAAQGGSAEQITTALAYEMGWARVDRGNSPALGRADAPIVVVEFTEFQCPFCKRAQETLTQLEAKYGDKVQLVYKSFPLDKHKLAKPAAIAAMAADRQGRFWEYKRAVFERQKDLRDEAALEQIAGEVGLDVARWKRDMQDPAIEAQIKADVAQGRSLGVTGTPCFFVNGYKLKGAKPLPAFEAVIDRELADRGL